MICVNDEKSLKKYKVELDKVTLEGLKFKIINECSVIKHIKEKQREDNLTSDYDFVHIRNYYKKFVERIDNNDFYGPPMIDIYEVEYDFYEEPKIVELIEEALNGNEEKALELLEYKDEDEICESLEDKLNNLLTNKNSFNSEKDLIYKAKELLDKHQNTKYQKPISIYLNDVKNCINLILIDEISYEEYLRVYNFLDKEAEPKRIKIINNMI